MIKIVEVTDEQVRFKDLEVGDSFLFVGHENSGPRRRTDCGYLMEDGSKHFPDAISNQDALVIPIYSKLLWSRKEEV